MNGTIKSMKKDRGFGFILAGEGKGNEYFFHHSQCQDPFDRFNEGDAVAFELDESRREKGPRAMNVRRAR